MNRGVWQGDASSLHVVYFYPKDLVPEVQEDRARKQQRGDAAVPPRFAPEHERRRGVAPLQALCNFRDDMADDGEDLGIATNETGQ